jgi:hypothetical protein
LRIFRLTEGEVGIDNLVDKEPLKVPAIEVFDYTVGDGLFFWIMLVELPEV